MPTVRKPLLVLLVWGATVGGSFAQLSANFTNQIACDRSVTFTNSSTGYTTVSWNFGDNNTSTAVSPTHQYGTSGTFTVVLTVSNGAISTSFSQTVTLFDPPSQSISGSPSACITTEETYTASSSGNNYQWSVTGGVITSGQGTNTITVRWSQTGAGTVSLVEQNPAGCSATASAAVQVHPLPLTRINVSSDQSGTSPVNGSSSACLYSTGVYHLRSPLNPGSTYQWEATGGDIIGTAQADSLVVFWDTEGDGLIKVTETTAFGCVGTSSVLIQVLPRPHASFNTADICLGSAALFTDQSTGDLNNWEWDFGDGNTSNDQNPSHVYTAAGTYQVTLTVASVEQDSSFYRGGCSDDTTITITVLQNPGPEIICPGTVCAGDAETYTTPQVAGATYNWSVTGGTITSGGGASDHEVTVQWGSGPVGTLSLQVTGAGTYCNLPTTIEIPIVPTNLQISGPATICRYEYTTYSAPVLPGGVYDWTVTGGNITQGDGTNSIVTYFNTSGTKTISLDLFHDLAECGGQDVITAQVFDRFYLSANPNACAQGSHTYTVNGTPAASGYAWNWTITGGTITAGQGTNSITVTWGNGPFGEVSVDAPAGVYCNTQERQGINIKPVPPPAALNGAMNVCAATTNTYFVPAGLHTTWTVTGGTVTSGGTAGSNFATVQWGSGTSGQITVVQEDRSSFPYCGTTTVFNVAISNNTPVTVSGPTPVCTGFTGVYTASGSSALPYIWEVSGGTIISGFGTNNVTIQWGGGPWGTVQVTELTCNNTDDLVVEITGVNGALIDTANRTCDGSSLTLFVPGDYAAFNWSTGSTDSFATITGAGTYSVSLTDANGCTTEASMTLGAMPTLPVPFASITGAGPSFTPITFLELTAHPAGHLYQWSTGGLGQRIYVTTAGTYSVTVTNDYGCTADAFVGVTNTPGGGLAGGGGFCPGGGGGGGVCPAVFPDFTTSVCNPIQFTNTTTPPAMAYVWDFHDGTYAWTEHTAHRFGGPGNYTVDLWASDNGVCWSLVQHQVNITSFLDADFALTQACFGQPVQFTDQSNSALPFTRQWNFGDGNTSTAQNPSHTYAAAGTYVVQLTIDDGICTESFFDTVNMRNLNAAFNYQQACFGWPTLFTDNSAGALKVVRWNWNFGDGFTSNLEHPSHRYAATGNYNVTLTVTDVAGCTASTTTLVNVIQFVAGNITYSGPTTFCEGESLVLNAPAGAGYTYRWSTGETTASITATKSGSYYVIVTNSTGCKDTTAPVVILVYPKPNAYIYANGPLTFCEFSNFVTLVANPAGPGFTYQWQKDGANLSTNQSTNLSGTGSSGSYTVRVTDNHGCSATSAAVVATIYPRPPFPQITASGPTQFCDGGNVVLTAPAGYTYAWTNGATTQSATVTTGGYHTVVVIDGNGCSNSGNQFVQVRPVPDMGLVAYGCYDVCLSDSSFVHGPSGMSSYQWSTGETTASILIDAPGTYNLTATNSYGCSASSSSLYISTTNFLGVNLGNDVSFCDGGVATFDAGPGFASYTWQNSSTAQTFSATQTGIYFVEVTDTNGCEGSDTVALTVFPIPVLDLADTIECTALNITLDAGAGFATYQWSDNTTNQTLAVSASGTYSVTVTDVNTCSATDAANVLFSIATTGLDLGGDVSFCEGGTITFDAGTGFTTYTWQDGSTGQTLTADVSDIYVVTATDPNGCVARDSVVLTVFQNPVVTLRPDTVICDASTIVLDAGAGFTTYAWSDNSTDQTLAVSSSGTYSVTVTDINACTATDDADVTYASTSSIIDATPDTAVCEGITVQLSVSGGVSYTWTPDPTLVNSSATPTATTTYYVSAIDSFGCAKTDSVVISILPLLIANAQPNVTVCAGEEVQLTASGGTEFIWFPATALSCSNCADPVATPDETTIYNVAVSQPGYCNSDTATVTVTVLESPEAGLDSIITVRQGGEVTFAPNGGFAEYDWWSDGWACEGCPTPTVSPNSTTTYTLRVTDDAGCTSTQQVLLRVLNGCEGNFFIPTAFSPNGDGHNDEFRILHPGDLQLIDLKVFNRWGEIVFETEDANKGWDGIYKGVKQELAVFAYYAQMTCGQDVKTVIGNVTLVH